MLEKIKKDILDTLFPISCLLCKKSNTWLCPECLKKIETIPEQVCFYCEKNISPQGRICPKCKIDFLTKKEKIPLDGLIVSSRYGKNGLARLIHFYKYNFIMDLSAPLGKIILEAFWKNNCLLPDLLVPVPLHPRRLRWRGFNQAKLLADYLSENLSPGLTLPVSNDIIQRQRYTQSQMKIGDYKSRQKNLRDAFAIENLSALKNKNVLLVDDVATTGSTLLECAKILKQAGAKNVWGIVLARQEIS